MIRIEVYKNSAGFWRWRIRARNGKIIGECVDSYKRKVGALKGINAFAKYIDKDFYTIVDGQDDPPTIYARPMLQGLVHAPWYYRGP